MSRPLRARLALPLAGALVAAASAVAVPSLSQAGAEPDNAQVQTTTSQQGPITLPPAVAGVPARVNIFVPAVPMPCTNCFLTGAEVDVVFADGRSANLDSGVMLHHLVVWNSGAEDATCGPDTPMGKLGERFFAAGNERTSGQLPPGFGYRYGDAVVKGDIDLMNHSATPQAVYIKTKVSHVAADAAPGMKPVRPVWLDVDNCRTSEYAVPAGPSNKLWTWKSNVTGRVVAAGGHVHDGGLRIDLANQTTGEQMCTSWAGYGTKAAYAGTIESMSTCVWDRVGTVRAGDTIAIDTYYDSPEAQMDAMGIVLAYVHETDDLAGGTTPPPGTFASSGTGRPPAAGGHHH